MKDLKSHLNEYLFEFTRTYLEDLLYPSFKEFLESSECARMHSELKAEAMLDWILSHKVKLHLYDKKFF